MAAVGAKDQQRNPDPSASRIRTLFAASPLASDDECGRRYDDALLGPELAAQSLGLQGRQRDHAPLWSVTHSKRFHRRGLAIWIGRTRTLLRQGRIRGRHFGPGRQY